MSRHRVAVTVFVETEASHRGVAEQHATITVKKALAKGDVLAAAPFDLDPVMIYRGEGDERVGEPLPTVTVHEVMETGVAAGNGMLWLAPTAKGYWRKSRTSK